MPRSCELLLLMSILSSEKEAHTFNLGGITGFTGRFSDFVHVLQSVFTV